MPAHKCIHPGFSSYMKSLVEHWHAVGGTFAEVMTKIKCTFFSDHGVDRDTVVSKSSQ